MTKTSLDTALRESYFNDIARIFEDSYKSDILRVSNNELAMPVVDTDGNEKFLIVKVSIPRGTRDGHGGYIPYDGYAAADDYRIEQESKKKKKEEGAE